jgi:integrin-linked kinase
MPRGSLYDLLHSAAGVVVDTAQAVRFALDIAKGMAYLHSLERIIPEYFLNSFHVMVSSIKYKANCDSFNLLF